DLPLDDHLSVRRRVDVAESLAHLPVPVGTRTVSPAVPRAEHEARAGRQCHRQQMPRPRPAPDPPDAVEDDPQTVDDEEEDVQQLERHGGPVTRRTWRVWRAALPRALEQLADARNERGRRERLLEEGDRAVDDVAT